LNTYLLFIDRAYHHLLRQHGKFGFIVPNNCLTIDSFQPFRKFLLENAGQLSVVNIFDKVFDEANVNNCILTFTKTCADTITLAEMNGEILDTVGTFPAQDFVQNQCIINISMVKRPEIARLMEKIEKNAVSLISYAKIKCGLGAYGHGDGIPPQTHEMIQNRIYHSKIKNGQNWFKYIDGEDVKRFFLGWSRCEYLKWGKHLREPRSDWGLFSTPRILVRQIPSPSPYCINACFTDEVILNDRNSMNIVYMKTSPLFLLAVLNSRLMSFWFVHKFDKLQRGIFPQFKVKELALFPIPVCNKPKQKRLISLAGKMLALNADIQTRRQRFLRRLSDNFSRVRITQVLKQFDELEFKQLTAELRKQKIEVLFKKQDELEEYFFEYQTQCRDLSRQIADTDSEIDRLVYEIYSLTDDEIKMIEG
jgi:hypothetical protein